MKLSCKSTTVINFTINYTTALYNIHKESSFFFIHIHKSIKYEEDRWQYNIDKQKPELHTKLQMPYYDCAFVLYKPDFVVIFMSESTQICTIYIYMFMTMSMLLIDPICKVINAHSLEPVVVCLLNANCLHSVALGCYVTFSARCSYTRPHAHTHTVMERHTNTFKWSPSALHSVYNNNELALLGAVWV